MEDNVEIVKVDNKNIDRFLGFSKEVYKNNPYYRDTLTRSAKGILKGEGEICKGSFIEGIMVIENGEILAICIFSIIDRMNDVLQIAYFEAKEGQEKAIDNLMDYGKSLAREKGIKTILAGLNLHVNYGLGYLASHFDSMQSLGSAYNPPYYLDYFQKRAIEEVNLTSYIADMKDFSLDINPRLRQRLLKNYCVRKADFKKIEREAQIYTDINNDAFKNHRFYYERRKEEDLELFKEYRMFLKEENLLFLQYKGKEVGFMLWYPDFNQLVKEGRSLGITSLLKSRLFPGLIDTFKIVELGVACEHQKMGGVYVLFDYCNTLTMGRYKKCESGWILDENHASKGFGIRWGKNEYKKYKVFLIDV